MHLRVDWNESLEVLLTKALKNKDDTITRSNLLRRMQHTCKQQIALVLASAMLGQRLRRLAPAIAHSATLMYPLSYHWFA
jgi:hypothetical protein